MTATSTPPDTAERTDWADLEIVENAPAIYTLPSGATGVFTRLEAFIDWKQRYGHFDSVLRSHAWLPETAAIGHDHLKATAQCRPAVMRADLRCRHEHEDRCSCVGDLVYRAACLHCAWEGEIRALANPAVEDAHDHSWPGWRDLPIVASRPPAGNSAKEREAMTNWHAAVTTAYPAGWLEEGGSIRTAHLGRHIPNLTGYGGYDLAAAAER
ncbi:DUF6349 family protein [Mycolicibacterium llatzerense]|uniref:DUF6349 family protein n=1 Tax=Mycolicibacterium llatzerense TaxID=280871 RepID=UPI0021B63382|nr:DUF6349 family protein [Mycolicibacterium llatzerense]MCT7372995.1 hypothetical protein [Mycolicibacterium llatzerense]